MPTRRRSCRGRKKHIRFLFDYSPAFAIDADPGKLDCFEGSAKQIAVSTQRRVIPTGCCVMPAFATRARVLCFRLRDGDAREENRDPCRGEQIERAETGKQRSFARADVLKRRGGKRSGDDED